MAAAERWSPEEANLDLEFGDLPEIYSGGRGRRPIYDALFARLVEQPGEWAKITGTDGRSRDSIRNTALNLSRRHESRGFEVVTRTGDDGETRIWIRYVGPNGEYE